MRTAVRTRTDVRVRTVCLIKQVHMGRAHTNTMTIMVELILMFVMQCQFFFNHYQVPELPATGLLVQSFTCTWGLTRDAGPKTTHG